MLSARDMFSVARHSPPPLSIFLFDGNDHYTKIVPNTTSATQASAFNIYTDHLNTPREIRNHANQLRWTWYPEVSGAFGAGLPNENPNTPALGVFTYNLRFPGQLYDPTSQLSYNYYRDYSSRTGRYIESDPIGLEGGINTYAYVEGNPLSFIDEDGLAPSKGAIIWDGIERIPVMGGGSARVSCPPASAAATREANIGKGIPANKLGPSGKPKIHIVKHPNQIKKAKDAARAEVGKGGTTEKHANPTEGNRHYHGVSLDGTKDRVHHEY